MSLKPLGDGVVVEREEEMDRNVGAIFIPKSVEESKVAAQGTVVALGPGLVKDDGTYIPIPLNVGDKVLFHKYGGVDVDFDNQKLKLIRLAEVLAVVE